MRNIITEEKIRKSLSELPQEQRYQLAIHATLQGIDIEKQLIPTLTNVCRGAEKALGLYLKNYSYINNK